MTRRRHDTTLARIVHLVESAQAQRAPLQLFIDRFAAWYTPAIVVLAVARRGGAGRGAPANVRTWLYRALVLLVVSCPCALVISTPVSIVSALAGAARQGVLVKGGIHLERLATVRAMAFDKTGTVTTGHLHARRGSSARQRHSETRSARRRRLGRIAVRAPHCRGDLAAARTRSVAIDMPSDVRALPASVSKDAR